MTSYKNNRFLRSIRRYRASPQHVVFLAMVMSIFCVNADKTQEGDAGKSTGEKRSDQQSGKRSDSKSRPGKKSSGKKTDKAAAPPRAAVPDRKDEKDGKTARKGDHSNKTGRKDSGQESDQKGNRGAGSEKAGAEKPNAGMAVGKTNPRTVDDKALPPSSSDQASASVLSLGVGAQGYIESVNGIVTLTMSNQEASMGVISEVSISEGQSVQKDDVLVVSSHYKVRENQKIVAELEYSLAKTELEITKNKAEKCKEKLGRHEKMLVSKAVSRQEFENIQKDSAEADLLVEKQKIVLQIAEQKIALCKELLEQCQIRAPMDGVILMLNGKVGEQCRPNEGLLMMADLTRLEIVTEVHENDISKIFIGQRAEISFPNKMQPITGYVNHISSIVRSNTLQEADPKKNQDLRVIEVRVALTDEDALNIRGFLRMHTDVRFFGPDEDQQSRAITAVNQARAV